MKKKKILRWMSMLLGLIMCLSLAACGNKQEAETEQPSGTEITCYADFSNGSETAEEDGLIKTEKRTVTEVNPETLAKELSDWSGWDFTLESYSVKDKTVTVDWAATSTLIAGMDDRTRKEDFTFENPDAMRWFMMDSLYRTIVENMSADEVYYTMDGGQELTINSLSPVGVFPLDVPYMASPFYYAHDDGRGDLIEESESSSQSTESSNTSSNEEEGRGDLIEDEYAGDDEGDIESYGRTKGTFWLDADQESGYLKMDGEGGFWIYDASGNLEHSGYLIYVDDAHYDMYLSNGELLDTLYCKGVMEMHFIESGAYYDRCMQFEE